jgi:hypothetical protein
MVPKKKIRASSSIDSDLADYMSTLAETFPVLRGAEGVRPWNPTALAQWGEGRCTAAIGFVSAYECVIFILLLASHIGGTRYARFSRKVKANLLRHFDFVYVFRRLGAEDQDAMVTAMKTLADPQA